jgi:hypothetical protein
MTGLFLHTAGIAGCFLKQKSEIVYDATVYFTRRFYGGPFRKAEYHRGEHGFWNSKGAGADQCCQGEPRRVAG